MWYYVLALIFSFIIFSAVSDKKSVSLSIRVFKKSIDSILRQDFSKSNEIPFEFSTNLKKSF